MGPGAAHEWVQGGLHHGGAMWDGLHLPCNADDARVVVAALSAMQQRRQDRRRQQREQEGIQEDEWEEEGGDEDLRAVRVNCCVMGDEGLRWFVELVHLCPSVEELAVTAAPLSKRLSSQANAGRRSVTWKGALQLHRLLESTSTLRKLDLSHCGLSVKSIILIAQALATNSSLTTLDLSDNLISLDTAKALSHVRTPPPPRTPTMWLAPTQRADGRGW
jgi:hypothetical protein